MRFRVSALPSFGKSPAESDAMEEDEVAPKCDGLGILWFSSPDFREIDTTTVTGPVITEKIINRVEPKVGITQPNRIVFLRSIFRTTRFVRAPLV